MKCTKYELIKQRELIKKLDKEKEGAITVIVKPISFIYDKSGKLIKIECEV